ncbi:hypothetical protein Ciccas_008823 [Cichlidogyrus casuarinus]|uniref:Uncharacterized protein n=1 Tax=Cichlidogyrus casuarinus TaxID=1844966 RepID=A0ABD2PYU0_9PLAT
MCIVAIITERICEMQSSGTSKLLENKTDAIQSAGKPLTLEIIQDCIFTCKQNDDFSPLLEMMNDCFGDFNAMAFSFLQSERICPSNCSDPGGTSSFLDRLVDIAQVRAAFSALVHQATENWGTKRRIEQNILFSIRSTIAKYLRESLRDIRANNSSSSKSEEISIFSDDDKNTQKTTEMDTLNKPHKTCIQTDNIHQSIKSIFANDLSNESRKFINLITHMCVEV